MGPGSTLASIIALQTGEASGLQLSALTALAVVLFVLAFGINALARLLVRRHEGGAARKGGLVSRAVTGIVGLFPRRAPKKAVSASSGDMAAQLTATKASPDLEEP